MKFLIVYMTWFMDSMCTETEIKEFDGPNDVNFHAAAKVYRLRHKVAPKNADYVAVQLAPTETMAHRKLTWKERLTGWI